MKSLRNISVLGMALAAAVAAASPPEKVQGYLPRGAFDILAVLPPAPRPGEPRAEADREIFKSTRALQGTARWQLATNDASEKPDDMFRDFSCAIGTAITPTTAPRTAALIHRAAHDTAAQATAAKLFNKRQRPFLIDKGPVCQPTEQLADSYDYPSGHTTLGWTMATLLAQLVPDRATAILARGRAYGDSRIVCGAHNASAVDAGRLTAASTLAAMSGLPRFQSDLASARQELRRLRRQATNSDLEVQNCESESALLSQRVF